MNITSFLSQLWSPTTTRYYDKLINDFDILFTAKVDAERASTSSSPCLLTRTRDNPCFAVFRTVSVDQMSRFMMGGATSTATLIQSLHGWSMSSVAVVNCHRYGEYFETESFNTFTSTIVRPRMKNSFINPLDIKSFRPFRM